MRVFVAGATGVIGSRVVRLLLEGRHDVCSIARSEEKAEPLRELGAGMMVTDVYDVELLRGAMAAAEPDVVVHQLTVLPDEVDARDAAAHFADNDRMRVDGTRALVDAAAAVGASRVVAQSIAFAYAPVGDWVKDESAPLFLDAPSPWGRAWARWRPWNVRSWRRAGWTAWCCATEPSTAPVRGSTPTGARSRPRCAPATCR